MSTSAGGRTIRKFIIGTRLCPPARTLASSPSSPSRSSASSTVSTRWYSKAAGFTGRLPRAGGGRARSRATGSGEATAAADGLALADELERRSGGRRVVTPQGTLAAASPAALAGPHSGVSSRAARCGSASRGGAATGQVGSASTSTPASAARSSHARSASSCAGRRALGVGEPLGALEVGQRLRPVALATGRVPAGRAMGVEGLGDERPPARPLPGRPRRHGDGRGAVARRARRPRPPPRRSRRRRRPAARARRGAARRGRPSEPRRSGRARRPPGRRRCGRMRPRCPSTARAGGCRPSAARRGAPSAR